MTDRSTVEIELEAARAEAAAAVARYERLASAVRAACGDPDGFIDELRRGAGLPPGPPTDPVDLLAVLVDALRQQRDDAIAAARRAA